MIPRSLKIFQLISNSLQENIPVMLLYVLESNGSSPGRQGFFMAVNEQGEMEGSIGGGIMEHKFVEMAKEKLVEDARHKEQGTSIRKQIHDKSAAKNQSGMICSGEQTILLYRVEVGDKPVIQKIISSQKQHKNGTLTLSPGRIDFSENTPEKDFDFIMNSEEDWLYKEKTGYKNQLFIIGGGHCALALSKLMSSMDFYIHLFDNRAELKTMEENDFVHEKKIVEEYTDITPLVQEGANNYVVIMTFGYRTDDLALRALLNKNFKYLGLLGSKIKVEKMFNDYKKEGVSAGWLQQIYTPIGLAIKSQTPEEIAVSIAGEIIKIKNSD